MKEVSFILKEPLKYSKGGDFHEEQVLTLRAPSMGSALTKKNARELKRLALAAIVEVRNKFKGEKPDPNEEKKKPEEEDKVKLIDLFYYGNIDVNGLCEAMAALAPAVVKIGTDIEFMKTHWERLSMEEQERLTGEYIESFLIS